MGILSKLQFNLQIYSELFVYTVSNILHTSAKRFQNKDQNCFVQYLTVNYMYYPGYKIFRGKQSSSSHTSLFSIMKIINKLS